MGHIVARNYQAVVPAGGRPTTRLTVSASGDLGRRVQGRGRKKHLVIGFVALSLRTHEGGSVHGDTVFLGYPCPTGLAPMGLENRGRNSCVHLLWSD